MTDDKRSTNESCEKKKVVEEEPVEVDCDCIEGIGIGETCSCGIVHKSVVKEKNECEDPWTGYERGKKKK